VCRRKGITVHLNQSGKLAGRTPRHYIGSVLLIALCLLLGYNLLQADSGSPGGNGDITPPDTSHDGSAGGDSESSPANEPEKEAENSGVSPVETGDDEFDLPMFTEDDPGFTWKEIERLDENPIFSEGEILKYQVSWMGISAGTITMDLDVHVDFNGKPAYRVTVTGETNKTFSVFFKVRDVITSIMDPETFNSIHYTKDIREGRYRKFQETRYDQIQRKAWVGDREYDLPPNSKDPIACIYAMRRYKIQDNAIVRMNSNSEGKSNYPVEIGFSSISHISLADGIRRRAIQGKPLPTWEGRIFEKKRSEVVFWLSDDMCSVPLKLEIKVRIGTLRADLISRSGPGWDINLEK
jgi:hypothetical protein